jgi:hypothetical protein
MPDRAAQSNRTPARGPRIFRKIAKVVAYLAGGTLLSAFLNLSELLGLIGINLPRWSVRVEKQEISLDAKRVIGIPFLLVNDGNVGIHNTSGNCTLSFDARGPYWVKVEDIPFGMDPSGFPVLIQLASSRLSAEETSPATMKRCP